MHRRLVIFFLLLFGLIRFSVLAVDRNKAIPTQEISFEQQVKPLFAKYCYGCHGDTKKKADLSLQAFQTEADVHGDRAIWEKVLHNIETREMPPEKKPQPSQMERELVARWIESKVLDCDCSKPDPGRVTLHRLNRAEYNNTIRDLLGVNFHPADDFPTDDSGYGFDNIGDVLSLSPILLEKYMAAAEKILDQAIIDQPDTNGPVVHIAAADMLVNGTHSQTRNNGIKLEREGHLETNYHFAVAGNYLLRIRAWGDQAGTEPPKMRVRINGNEVELFNVNGTFYDGEIFQHRFYAPIGDSKISLAYINNFVDRENPDPDRRDRNLAVEYLEIIGPSGPPEFPETHKRIFAKFFKNKKSPAEIMSEVAHGSFFDDPSDTISAVEYAHEITAKFAERAFRRPVTKEEVDRLMGIYSLARGDGANFEGAIKMIFEAILVSPHFLFRGELQPEPDNPNKVFPIDEFALASRLSYFLWSTTPDEELLALARKNALRKHLNSTVKRMLRDPKAAAFVQNFPGQWLQLRNLKNMQPDPQEFPSFDEDLRSAMQRETELLFENVMKHDRSILEILNANYTFLNERLAKHYGIDKVKGEEFRKVSLRKSDRGGVLTQASVLTLTSNPTRTSPVKRGKWVLENILGTPPPPPPPNVPDLKESKHGPAQGTLRQRMEQHRQNPECANCHARMDPIGFSMENFDGIGAWRKTDDGADIDPSGTLVTGESFKGASELRKILVEKKKDEFARCLTEKMLTYALGRGLEYYDKCAVDKICHDLSKHNYSFSQIIFGIVNSVPFQQRRGEGAR